MQGTAEVSIPPSFIFNPHNSNRQHNNFEIVIYGAGRAGITWFQHEGKETAFRHSRQTKPPVLKPHAILWAHEEPGWGREIADRGQGNVLKVNLHFSGKIYRPEQECLRKSNNSPLMQEAAGWFPRQRRLLLASELGAHCQRFLLKSQLPVCRCRQTRTDF